MEEYLYYDYTNIAISFGFTDMLYFFLKHCMNKLSGLSVPISMPSTLAFTAAASIAASKLMVASFSSSLNLAISLSFVFNFSVKSGYFHRGFCN